MTNIADTTIELKLSTDTIQRLHTEAARLQIPLNDLVREAIEDYLEVLEDTPEDTPDEKIIADFKEAWHQAMTGQIFPIEQLFAELADEMEEDGTRIEFYVMERDVKSKD